MAKVHFGHGPHVSLCGKKRVQITPVPDYVDCRSCLRSRWWGHPQGVQVLDGANVELHDCVITLHDYELVANSSGNFTGATTGATMALNTWDYWVNGGTMMTAATSSTTNTIWVNWQSTTTTVRNIRFTAPPPKTPEELAEMAERQRLARVEAEDRKRLQVEAQQRAQALLLEVLDDDQRKEYESKRYFTVKLPTVVSLRSHLFRSARIHHGSAGNVRMFGEDVDKELMRLCGHLLDGAPAEDSMIAQKLMLETDPEAYLRLANAS